MRTKRHVENAAVYVILIFLSVIWLIPIAWIVLTSFRAGGGAFVPEFIPKEFTFDNYFKLWTDNIYPFRKWFANTFIVAIASCILSTFLTLSISYVLSRLRFKLRKTYMNFALILGMFPGFMSMIAVYYVLKTVGLTQSLVALVLVYSAGAGINFYICKGFFDTIPRSLDEAAKIDGATNSQVFSKIILPLSSPIIVYTSLMAFMAPWADFIFARIIMGDNYSKYTVAIGMYQMLEKENIFNYFTTFAAGCVCIGVPIVILFSFLQRFYVEGVTGGSVKS
ncbi:MAG TPA: sugar ABC transporter permease [Oscillospiraceae bacterium]|nr:sugar ABC transporter permease [Oscillospiraceae bacterium]